MTVLENSNFLPGYLYNQQDMFIICMHNTTPMSNAGVAWLEAMVWMWVQLPVDADGV